jgi:hypothetical protein
MAYADRGISSKTNRLVGNHLLVNEILLICPEIRRA